MFAVLSYPAFRFIWLGAMVSNVGNWMETVAQSWLVQQQSGSPFLVELLAAYPGTRAILTRPDGTSVEVTADGAVSG